MSMSQPVLFVIDDDAGTARALREDLARRFGEDFRVIGETSAPAGLAVLRGLADSGGHVALLIVDHNLSGMPGADFLARAHEMHPLAKRVLLVERDYSARSPIVQAMTLGQADYHISKPWMAEQVLYREVSGFLAEWAKDQQAGFELFRVIGLEERGTHELRELFTKFGVPFRFYSADGERGGQLLAEQGLDASRLPVLIRHDGYTMVEPTLDQVITATGGSTVNDVSECDVAIVGAGPAGLTAAVYAASEGLLTVVLEETVSGGQAGSSPMIRNYPGFPHGVSGYELTRRSCEQAWMFGAHMVFSQRVTGLECRGEEHVVHLAGGQQVTAKAVIVATGIAWRRLGVPRARGAGRLRRLLRRRRERTAGDGGPGRLRGGRRELGRPDRAVPGAACPPCDAAGARGQPGAVDVGLPDPRDRGHRQPHGAPADRGHRRPRSRPPRSPHPARPAGRPDRAGPGGGAVRADRRRAPHAVAARNGPAPLGLRPDRARRGAGRVGPVALAARPRAAPARDLRPRGFRRGRRPLPLDQAGCLRRR